MEEILKFENRKKHYQFLIDEYGFEIIQGVDKEGMGYYVNLISKFFFLRYANDRMIFEINIASLDDLKNTYSLSFIKDLIYNPESINAGEETEDNTTKIHELNNFLRQDFDKISELFKSENYADTKKRLEEGLKKQYYIKYPFLKPKDKL